MANEAWPQSTARLYEWPNVQGSKNQGQTFDFFTGRHVYPKIIPPVGHSLQRQTGVKREHEVIRDRVEAVLKCDDMPVHIGNIISFIVDDLALVTAEKERGLLPEIAPFIPIFKYDITEECKAMLNDKVKRFQVQHAHNLALTGMIDVVIMWNEQNNIATKVNMAGIKQAESMSYGWLDRDRMHAKPKPKRNPLTKKPCLDDQDPRLREAEENLPQPTCMNGFYSIIPLSDLPRLLKLRDTWGLRLVNVVEPKLMTTEQQIEMELYHASRRNPEEKDPAKKVARCETVETETSQALQKRHEKMKNATYLNALRKSVKMSNYLELYDGAPSNGNPQAALANYEKYLVGGFEDQKPEWAAAHMDR